MSDLERLRNSFSGNNFTKFFDRVRSDQELGLKPAGQVNPPPRKIGDAPPHNSLAPTHSAEML